MGGGGGKFTGSSASIPPELQEAAQQLLNIGESQFDLGLPGLQTGAGQANDILLTGSTPALLPITRQVTEDARSAATTGNRDLTENLVRNGISGTEFQNTVAAGNFAADSAISQIPLNLAAPTLEAAAGRTFGLTQEGLAGIQGAASGGSSGIIPGRQAGGVQGGLGGAVGGAGAGASFGPYGALAGALLGGVNGAK